MPNLVTHFNHALNVYRYHVAPTATGEHRDPEWAKRWLKRSVRDNYITQDEAVEIQKECKEILL